MIYKVILSKTLVSNDSYSKILKKKPKKIVNKN